MTLSLIKEAVDKYINDHKYELLNHKLEVSSVIDRDGVLIRAINFPEIEGPTHEMTQRIELKEAYREIPGLGGENLEAYVKQVMEDAVRGILNARPKNLPGALHKPPLNPTAPAGPTPIPTPPANVHPATGVSPAVAGTATPAAHSPAVQPAPATAPTHPPATKPSAIPEGGPGPATGADKDKPKT